MGNALVPKMRQNNIYINREPSGVGVTNTTDFNKNLLAECLVMSG